MDLYISPFNIGFGIAITGTVSFTVQHTFDDVNAAGYNPATGTWYNHPDVTAKIANIDGNYAFPVTAVRLVNDAGTTGTTTGTFIQAGLVGG